MAPLCLAIGAKVHGVPELAAAVAAQGPEHVSGQAFAVHAHQNKRVLVDLPFHQSDVNPRILSKILHRVVWLNSSKKPHFSRKSLSKTANSL